MKRRRLEMKGAWASAVVLALGLGLAMAGACTPVSRTFENTGGGGSGGSGGMASLCEPGTSEPCYTGTPGTEDVGACKKGTHLCLPTGDGYGECVGEVLPIAEVCTTPIDEGCDGPNPVECPALGHVWSKSFGFMNEDVTTGVVVDPVTNDIIATGYFRDTIDFGAGPMASTGSDDILLVRFTADGQIVWAKRFGDASAQTARAIALDSTGAIYIAGDMAGSIDFGNGTPIMTSAGADDAFVAKFNPDGTIIWSRLFGDTNTQGAKSIAVTPTDDVIVVGTFYGFIPLTGMELPSNNNSRDMFVIKLDPKGLDTGAKKYGSPSSDEMLDVAVDSAGASIVTGQFLDTIDFGTLGTFVSAGNSDAFVLKLGPDLVEQWVRVLGDTEAQRGHSVAVTPTDDVFVSGDFAGSIMLDDGTSITATAPERSMYLLALAPDGVMRWGAAAGTMMATGTQSMLAVDPSTQSVIAAGYFSGSINFGGGFLTANTIDSFVAKMSWDGSHIASRSFGGPLIDAFFGLDVSANGDIFIVGGHQGPAAFGGDELPASNGQNDVQALFVRLLP